MSDRSPAPGESRRGTGYKLGRGIWFVEKCVPSGAGITASKGGRQSAVQLLVRVRRKLPVSTNWRGVRPCRAAAAGPPINESNAGLKASNPARSGAPMQRRKIGQPLQGLCSHRPLHRMHRSCCWAVGSEGGSVTVIICPPGSPGSHDQPVGCRRREARSARPLFRYPRAGAS